MDDVRAKFEEAKFLSPITVWNNLTDQHVQGKHRLPDTTTMGSENAMKSGSGVMNFSSFELSRLLPLEVLVLEARSALCYRLLPLEVLSCSWVSQAISLPLCSALDVLHPLRIPLVQMPLILQLCLYHLLYHRFRYKLGAVSRQHVFFHTSMVSKMLEVFFLSRRGRDCTIVTSSCSCDISVSRK